MIDDNTLRSLRAKARHELGELPIPEELWMALERSIRLQNHYVELLNMYDGGQRLMFAGAAGWVARLRQIGEVPKMEQP